MKKIVLLALVSLLLSTAVVVRFTSLIAASLPVHNINTGRVIAQTDSTTTIYLDPPTINSTTIGEEFTVNLMIRDAPDIQGWQAGMTFNPSVLECTGFFEGEFLKNAGPTYWVNGTINNTVGVITAHGCILIGQIYASGSGRLAYLTFKVKAPGVSDIHLQDVKLTCWILVDTTPVKVKIPTNIIDVYTVVVDTIPHTVLTVSNSTGIEAEYGSGFYDHAFSIPAKKISFKITGPYLGFSNITIPKTLLNVSTLDEWKVVIDGTLLNTEEKIITENETHTSIYFTYSAGIHYVQITTRPLIGSTVSITLSSTNIIWESNVTMRGNITAEDHTARPNVIVTILFRCIAPGFSRWTTFMTLTTDLYSNYSYTWTPETVGTYEFMTMWEGDDNTFGDVSDVETLTVRERFIYIRANGTVDPQDAPISSINNVTYTFTRNINASIVVQRDDVVVDGAGHTLRGAWLGKGIILEGSNVTIKNMEIKAFDYGIHICLPWHSNSIVGNNIRENNLGIWLDESSNNRIFGNNLANNEKGIWLYKSSNNVVSGNNITNNDDGIGGLLASLNNKFYHNNFIDNNRQVYIHTSGYANFWDDGYPSGGNYWSDYVDVDEYRGSYQDETGSDGIWDHPYEIDENNQDNYPLVNRWTPPDITSPIINILSPQNITYTTTSVPLTFTFNEPASWIGYCLDNQANVTITGNTTLTGLAIGPHNVLIHANDTSGNMGYSETVYFTVHTVPPNIEILSPKNKTYTTSSVPLSFTVDEATSWMGYSLDGQANITISGNTTLSGLSDGSHRIIIYAKDTAGNTGASEIIYFSIKTKKAEAFLVWIVAPIVIIAVAGAALLVYFIKIKKTT